MIIKMITKYNIFFKIAIIFTTRFISKTPFFYKIAIAL